MFGIFFFKEFILDGGLFVCRMIVGCERVVGRSVVYLDWG